MVLLMPSPFYASGMILAWKGRSNTDGCAATASKKNVKPEIAWSQFRRRFTPGFEKIIQEGVTAGWYDTTRPLDV